MELKAQPVGILAYTAGIVDGEGCICIRRSNAGGRRLAISGSVTISTSDYPLACWLQETFGGALYRDRSKKGLKHRDNFIWRFHSAEGVTSFLKPILPYLRVKRRQAELVLEFYSVRHRPQGRATLPPEEMTRRLRLEQECKRLNKNGAGS